MKIVCVAVDGQEINGVSLFQLNWRDPGFGIFSAL